MKDLKLICKKISLAIVSLFVLLILVLFFVPIITMAFNPMRRPEPMIRHHVLRLTPMGTHIDDVLEVVENNNNWRISRVNFERGFAHPRPYILTFSGTSICPLTGAVTVGDKHIRASAGPYWPANVPVIGMIVTANVSISWGFDADGKLIEVYVRVRHGW